MQFASVGFESAGGKNLNGKVLAIKRNIIKIEEGVDGKRMKYL